MKFLLACALDFATIFLVLFLVFSASYWRVQPLLELCMLFSCARDRKRIVIFVVVVVMKTFLFALEEFFLPFLRSLSLLEEPVFLVLFNLVLSNEDSRCL